MTPPDPTTASADPQAALAAAVLEIEAHAADEGWDQPARLYALVDTAQLVAGEPELADTLGLAGPITPGSLTPVEQDQLSPDVALERVLEAIMWPAAVGGCAAVVERLVLPPGADDELPDDETEALGFAAGHPDRQEVRIVAGATRGGATYCALRMRAHDDPESLVTGPDVVPGLLQRLLATLQDEPETGEREMGVPAGDE